MILGIGLDMIETARVKKSLKNPRFIDKVYTSEEQKYLSSRNGNAQSAAGIFAAKEAVSKALGTGFGAVRWKEIEILRNGRGKPYARLHGAALKRMKDMGGRHVHVSITHLKELAAAQAIIEGEPVGFDETGEGATVGNDDAVEGETVSCGESAEGETVGNGKDEEVEPACNDEGTD
ncbi:MAG: holo-ACP synthase [Caldicoprobacterales bacterium]|nr:holo-ACP synthase [Clostridiales bacterium]